MVNLNMYKIFLIFFLLQSSYSISQPFHPYANLNNVNETSDSTVYYFSIYPGKYDTLYRIEIISTDGSKNPVMISSANIKIRTEIHKKFSDYKKDEKIITEWSFIAYINENSEYDDGIITVGNCSKKRHLTGTIIIQQRGNYNVNIYNSDAIILEEKITF
jgi:hypothetical protein